MYQFDGNEEAATVEIEVMPHNYVRVRNTADEKPQAAEHGRLLYCVKKIREGNDGKLHRMWDAETDGRMWVPPRIADELCNLQAGDREDRESKTTPTARILRSRSQEEALGKDKGGTERRKPSKSGEGE